MSKIKPSAVAAFNIAFTKNELDRLEGKIDQRTLSLAEELDFIAKEVRSATKHHFQGKQGLDGQKGSKGDRGETGLEGRRGPKGEKGDKGETGDIGLTGPSGPIGLKGEIGAIGPIGPKGDTGPIGLQGIEGPQGVIGPEGPQGFPGLQGAVGEKGEKGDTGATGPKGDVGERGLDGEKGEKGDPGVAGESAPDVTPKFEELRKDFQAEVKTHQDEINRRIDQRLSRISTQSGGVGTSGGGSYKLLDNADVEYAPLSKVNHGDVLAFNSVKNKFVLSPANLLGGEGTIDSAQLYGLIDSDYVMSIVNHTRIISTETFTGDEFIATVGFNANAPSGAFLINNESILSHGNGALTSNTAVGLDALDNNLTGSHNTAIGFEALKISETGNQNTALGSGAGKALISGDGNVLIGGNNGADIDGLNNQILISDGAGNKKIHMDDENNLYIGANADVNLSSLTITETDSVASVPISSFDISYRTAKFTIQVHETINNIHHSAEVLLLHDSVTPRITVFGVLTTSDSDLANFSADINNNDVRLLTTPSSSNHMVYKVLRSSIKS